MNRILLLEDDPGLTEGLSYALSKTGFSPILPEACRRPVLFYFPYILTTFCCWMSRCPTEPVLASAARYGAEEIRRPSSS